MSTHPATERIYNVLVVLAALVLIGTAAGLSYANKGMQPQDSKGGGGGGGIDLGRAIGGILQGLTQPRPYYPPMGPYEYPSEPRDTGGRIYQGEPSGRGTYDGEPSAGTGEPREPAPTLPPQFEPTPTVKPSTPNLLGGSGGNPIEQLEPPTKKPVGPDDLLNSNPGNPPVQLGNDGPDEPFGGSGQGASPAEPPTTSSKTEPPAPPPVDSGLTLPSDPQVGNVAQQNTGASCPPF
jgi:hypothetical protein